MSKVHRGTMCEGCFYNDSYEACRFIPCIQKSERLTPEKKHNAKIEAKENEDAEKEEN